MKTASKLLALMAIFVLAVIPLIAADGSDATVNRQGQWSSSGFTDNNAGTLRVTLINDATDAVEIKLMVYETGNHDNVYTTKTVTVPGKDTDEGKLAVDLSWKFGSSGTKYVDVWAYDSTDTLIDNPLLNESSVQIDVSHSIWKNSVTYVVIVVIAIIVIIVLVMYIRSTKKTKADTTMSDRTFTKLHNEKVGKKAAAAEKKEYKSSGNKTRKK